MKHGSIVDWLRAIEFDDSIVTVDDQPWSAEGVQRSVLMSKYVNVLRSSPRSSMFSITSQLSLKYS